MILLDGALGTELARRGVPTPEPAWSAAAIRTHPHVIRSIHADYAAAGATVHTAATFRTRPDDVGPEWAALAAEAVALARSAVPAGHRVAGSLAPIRDCWHPEWSPADPRPAQDALARVLAAAGCDLVLCETHANPHEAIAAVEAGVATGLPTWLALTAGWRGDLLDPAAMARIAADAVRRGAAAVLVNCVPAERAAAWVERVADAGAPFGVYANALDPAIGPRRYADLAAGWIDAGATIVGGCCGTGPEHLSALSQTKDDSR
jgi:S-methylmethionine-dependent homocysteine/selenocysteine methylase